LGALSVRPTLGRKNPTEKTISSNGIIFCLNFMENSSLLDFQKSHLAQVLLLPAALMELMEHFVMIMSNPGHSQSREHK
jgi:hypothetical protein